jgi:MFS family permease
VLEGFRYDDIGLAVSLSLLLYGSGALTAGYLAPKIGERNGMLISIFLQGFSCFFVFLNGLLGFFIFMASLGFFGSFYHPLSNSYIYSRFEKRAGEAMGLHGVGANIGQVIYPSIAVLVGITYGWRVAIISFGVLLMLASSVLIGFPQNHTIHEKPRIISYFRVMSYRPFLLIAIFAIMFGLYYRGVELYLPTYLKNVKEFGVILAGISTSVLLAGGALGQYIGGRMGDKRGPELVLLIMSLIGFLSLLTLQFLPMLVGIMLSVFLLGLSFYAQQPACNLFIARKFEKEWLALAYGVWYLIAFGFAGVSAFIAGTIGQWFGFQALFAASSMLSLSVIGIGYYIYRKERKRRTTAQPFSYVLI